MIVLKKDNHYCHVDSREKAQAKVNDGYEVIKNKFGGPKIVKQAAEPKKKMFSKKKQLFIQARSRFATTLEIRRNNGNIKFTQIHFPRSE